MIEWYKDESLIIYFSCNPGVAMIIITPSMGDWEKKQIKKYPFLNKKSLVINIFYKGKEFIINIPKNYTWDGATIPHFLWRLIGPPTSPEFLVPSMIHDKLCERHSLINNNRKLSSKIFKALLISAGVNKLKAQIMYFAVELFQIIKGNW